MLSPGASRKQIRGTYFIFLEGKHLYYGGSTTQKGVFPAVQH